MSAGLLDRATARDRYAEEASARAESIVSRFRHQFLTSDGFIARDYPVGARTIFDNFDDLAPFLNWWGATDLLADQVTKLTLSDFGAKLPFGNLLHAYKIDEYIGGLNVVAKATGDRHCRALIDGAITECWELLGDPALGLSEFYDLKLEARSPFFSPWSAGLLETFLELDDCGDSLQPRVAEIIDRWWSHPYVLASGLFPFRGAFDRMHSTTERFWALANRWAEEPPICWTHTQANTLKDYLRRSGMINGLRKVKWEWGSSGLWSQLMKSNTTPIFLSIALFTRTQEPKWRQRIERWFTSVQGLLASPDGVRAVYRNGSDVGPATLVAGFISIDAACDAYWFVNRDQGLLEFAERIARSCLAWQWENGLVPMSRGADCDHLDGQVDFAIALRRIAELKRDEEFLDASIRLLQTAFRLHDTPAGYCTHVRHDGSVVELPRNTVDPKYNGLALKGLVSLATLGKDIYGSPELHDLFKDR